MAELLDKELEEVAGGTELAFKDGKGAVDDQAILGTTGSENSNHPIIEIK